MPPTLSDVLLYDLARNDNPSPDAVWKRIEEYIELPASKISGLRPWPHKEFVRGLSAEEREAIARVAIHQAKTEGLRTEGGLPFPRCRTEVEGVLTCGESIPAPEDAHALALDDLGRFIVLTKTGVFRRDLQPKASASKAWRPLPEAGTPILDAGLQVLGSDVYWATERGLVHENGKGQIKILPVEGVVLGFFVAPDARWIATPDALTARDHAGNTTQTAYVDLLPAQPSGGLGPSVVVHALLPDPEHPERALLLFAFVEPDTMAYRPRKLFQARLEGGKWQTESSRAFGGLTNHVAQLLVRCDERRFLPSSTVGVAIPLSKAALGPAWEASAVYEVNLMPDWGYVVAASCDDAVAYAVTERSTGDREPRIFRVPDGFGLKPSDSKE